MRERKKGGVRGSLGLADPQNILFVFFAIFTTRLFLCSQNTSKIIDEKNIQGEKK